MKRKYISNELVHWTGRAKQDSEAFSTLTAICKGKHLLLSYCPNYVANGFEPRSAMACFTDIPLSHSREHCETFGRFGIAFGKQRMIAHGANPALYTTGVHFERIVKLSSLLAQMLDFEKDRQWREASETYQFSEDHTLALKEVTELLQQYAHRNEDAGDHINYHQREWRLTFNSLPFAGQGKHHDPGTVSFRTHDGKSYGAFRFAPEDVEFLIVPLRWWWRARQLARELGCRLKVYEFSVGR